MGALMRDKRTRLTLNNAQKLAKRRRLGQALSRRTQVRVKFDDAPWLRKQNNI